MRKMQLFLSTVACVTYSWVRPEQKPIFIALHGVGGLRRVSALYFLFSNLNQR